MYVCLHSCLWNSVLEIQKLCKALQVQVCFPPQSSATQLSSLEAVTVISFLISQKYFSHVETSKHTYSFFPFYKVMAAHYTFCSSVQPLSHVWLCEPVDCTTPGLPGVGPSPSRGVYPDSCPLSWWCHPTISKFSVRKSIQHIFNGTSGSICCSNSLTHGILCFITDKKQQQKL